MSQIHSIKPPYDALAVKLRQRVETHFDGSKEYWRDVVGYEGLYRVSSWGRVKSLDRHVPVKGCKRLRFEPGKVLTPAVDRGGYLRVLLAKNGVRTNRYVSGLVCEAFHGPCPTGKEVGHFPDRDPTNNFWRNLGWYTRKENHAHKVIHGTAQRGEKGSGAKLKDSDIPLIHLLYDFGYSMQRIARVMGVTETAIRYILHGLTFQAAQPAVPARIRHSGYGSPRSRKQED